MPRFLSAVTFLPSSCPTVFTHTWRTSFSSGAIQANLLPSGESLGLVFSGFPKRMSREMTGAGAGSAARAGANGTARATSRAAMATLGETRCMNPPRKSQVVREPAPYISNSRRFKGDSRSGGVERPATPWRDGSRDGDGSGRRARRHRMVRSVRGDGADAPGGPRGGALPRRRLRRPLLPAPRRDRPGARGRGGEPWLRLGGTGRGRAGGEGRPDRLRLHRGPVAPGHPGGGANRGGHRRRRLAGRAGPDAPRL